MWGYLVLSRVWNHCTHYPWMSSISLSILLFSSRAYSEFTYFIVVYTNPLQGCGETELVALLGTFFEFADIGFEETPHYCDSRPFQFLVGLCYGFLGSVVGRCCVELDPCPFPANYAFSVSF